jgi:hypothetical protein
MLFPQAHAEIMLEPMTTPRPARSAAQAEAAARYGQFSALAAAAARQVELNLIRAEFASAGPESSATSRHTACETRDLNRHGAVSSRVVPELALAVVPPALDAAVHDSTGVGEASGDALHAGRQAGDLDGHEAVGS